MSEVIEQGATRWLDPSVYLPPSRKTRTNTYKGRVEINAPGPRRKVSLPDPRYPRKYKSIPSEIFKRGRAGPPTFGNKRIIGVGMQKALMQGSRRFPMWRLLDLGLSLADVIDKGQYIRKELDRYVIVGGGWFLNQECSTFLFPPRMYKYQQNLTSQTTSNCLSGQAITGTQPWPYTIGATARTVRLWSRTNPPGGGGGFTKHKEWQRTISAVGLPSQAKVLPTAEPNDPAPEISPAINPNVMRVIPSVRPMPQPKPEPSPDGPPVRVKAQAQEFAPGRPRRFVTPRGRTPPKPKEKEGKYLSKSAQQAAALMAGLDTVSELSEIVDAFFDALPKDVKRKWEKKHKARGLLDQAGQYGIDGADWKMAALFWNWHKIDADRAFKNLVNNAAQDTLHGLLHRNLPVNTGRALDPGIKAIEKMLKNHLYL